MAEFSQTQLSNINTLAGILVLVLPKFGIFASNEELAFIIGASWSIGWTIYNWYQRYQKGDLHFGGTRKSTQY